MTDTPSEMPESGTGSKIARTALQMASSVPIAGGVFSAIAGAWSEKEQERVNNFLRQWLSMLEDEIKEKHQTIIEIMTRLDIHEEQIAERIKSDEYQSLLRKTFREWAGAESEQKRVYIRNILSNAGSTSVVTDDVVKLFIDWLKKYSELHFEVIGIVYKNQSTGITRGEVWRQLGKQKYSENSAEADLFKLLIFDLNTGRIIRQHREYDYYGIPIAKTPTRRPKGSGPKPLVSAFDEEERYELTGLGQQFVHYAMNDLPLKLEYKPI